MLRRLLRHWVWAIPCLAFLAVFEFAPRMLGRDLYPFPDAEEYALLSQRLAHFQAPLLPIGLHLYPARYSLAFPILLTPFDWIFGDLRRVYLGSAFFGLLAVAMVARTGSWLTGSRYAGALGALFFALHVATAQGSTEAMSEPALIAILFLAIELARPWIEPSAKPGGPLRAAALGLALGWLTVCKATFVFWALALALLVGWRSLRSRRWAPFACVAAAGLLCFVADWLYRRWAFGGAVSNGYVFWGPGEYSDIGFTFNRRYLTEPPLSRFPNNNLAAYGKMLLGSTGEFYNGRYMFYAAVVAAVAALWPWRRGRPSRTVVALALGWTAVVGAFCAFYFFQSHRFLDSWIPLLDLLVAWGLIRVPFWTPLRRGPAKRLRLVAVGRTVAMLAACVLLFEEVKALNSAYPPELRRWQPSYLDRIIPMLAKIPDDAWVFTNYQAPLIQAVRSGGGPVGALNVWRTDSFLMNGHNDDILANKLPPFAENPAAKDWIDPVPQIWRDGPTLLIGLDDRWLLTSEELDRLLARPVYILAVYPPDFLSTGFHFSSVIQPLLEREGALEPIQQARNVTLFKLERNGSVGSASAAP